MALAVLELTSPGWPRTQRCVCSHHHPHVLELKAGAPCSSWKENVLPMTSFDLLFSLTVYLCVFQCLIFKTFWGIWTVSDSQGLGHRCASGQRWGELIQAVLICAVWEFPLPLSHWPGGCWDSCHGEPLPQWQCTLFLRMFWKSWEPWFYEVIINICQIWLRMIILAWYFIIIGI